MREKILKVVRSEFAFGRIWTGNEAGYGHISMDIRPKLLDIRGHFVGLVRLKCQIGSGSEDRKGYDFYSKPYAFRTGYVPAGDCASLQEVESAHTLMRHLTLEMLALEKKDGIEKNFSDYCQRALLIMGATDLVFPSDSDRFFRSELIQDEAIVRVGPASKEKLLAIEAHVIKIFAN